MKFGNPNSSFRKQLFTLKKILFPATGNKCEARCFIQIILLKKNLLVAL